MGSGSGACKGRGGRKKRVRRKGGRTWIWIGNVDKKQRKEGHEDPGSGPGLLDPCLPSKMCTDIFPELWPNFPPSSASRKSRPQEFRELLISDIFTTPQQTQFRLSSNTSAAELKARFAI